MKWASTLSLRPESTDAFAESMEAIEQQLGGETPDLLLGRKRASP